MYKVVTYSRGDIDYISDYTGSNYTQEKIIELIHNGDIRKQMVEDLRKFANGDISKLSDSNLGYYLQSVIKKRYSRISNIQFHNRPLNKFGGTHQFNNLIVSNARSNS